MSRAKLAVAAGLLWALPMSAMAAVIDDFSSSTAADSPNYNTVLTFGSPVASFATFGGYFDPSGGSNATTFFLRNTGLSLSSGGGDSVSIDVSQNITDTSSAGLGFSTSVNSSANNFELGIQRLSATSYTLEGGATTPLPGYDGTKPSTLTVTRNSLTPTRYDYVVTGGGLITPVSGFFTESATAGQAVYFGMEVYNGAILEDNLAFSAVPEPSCIGLLGLGALAFVTRRRGR